MTTERNPFDVLGVSPSASRAEIERAAQRRLAELSLGVSGGGGTEREHEVRRALDELRDPRRRLEAEVLSRGLVAENVDASDFREIVEALTKAAKDERPDAVVVAEEMLWSSIEFPPAYELPGDHAERKRAAFGAALDDTPPALLSFDDVDWGEVVEVSQVATSGRGT
jgi:curved DNA-binding protein CbpA